jgi:hypothetical protein
MSLLLRYEVFKWQKEQKNFIVDIPPEQNIDVLEKEKALFRCYLRLHWRTVL